MGRAESAAAMGKIPSPYCGTFLLIRVLMGILEDVLISISSGEDMTLALANAIRNLIAVRKLTPTVD